MVRGSVIIMAINSANLQRKLAAILAKDVDLIMAQNVYLPFVGNNYTREKLTEWLAARSSLLEQAIGATDQQIQQRINNYYNSLGASDKVIADKIIAGQQYNLTLASNFNAYEKLVAILLSKFITQ